MSDPEPQVSLAGILTAIATSIGAAMLAWMRSKKEIQELPDFLRRAREEEIVRLMQEQVTNSRASKDLIEGIYTHLRTDPDQRRIMDLLEQQSAIMISLREQQFRILSEMSDLLRTIAAETRRRSES